MTKLLPTASNALVTSSDGILVVDDNEYPPGWLSALADAWKKDPAHIMVSFKRPLYKLALKMMRVAPSTLVAGFAGYVVPKRALTTEAVVIMREAAKASTDCLLSDDYVITAALAHVPIRSAGLSYMEFEKFVATLPDDDGGALHKLSDTKKRYSRCLGSMRRTLTPNVVESDGFDSGSPLVLTYAPDHRSQVRNLVASLRKFGYAYKVLGLGEAWKGNAPSYLTGIRDELVRLRRSPSLPALVCIVDAYDVIMQSTPSELAKAHAAYDKEILAGVETNANAKGRKYCGLTEGFVLRSRLPGHRLLPGRLSFNSGVYMGKVSALLGVLNGAIDAYWGDPTHRDTPSDQKMVFEQLVARPNMIAFDVHGIMVHNRSRHTSPSTAPAPVRHFTGPAMDRAYAKTARLLLGDAYTPSDNVEIQPSVYWALWVLFAVVVCVATIVVCRKHGK
jgi:hypothetical protein